MATSGDQEKSSSALEEPDSQHACTPCDSDGKHAIAVGYCTNCKEYLCRRCFDGHLIPSVTRKHVLLDRGHLPVPGAVTDEGNESFSRLCPQHEEEVINFYCQSHSFFGCQFCCFKHQKTCKDVQCIPEVCKTVTNTEEYKDFAETLTSVAKNCTQLIKEFKDKLQFIESSHTKIISEIQEFKRELLDAIDKAEKDLVDKAKRLKEENSKKAEELTDKFNVFLKENQVITSMIERLQKTENQTDLYIAMVKSRDTLKTIQDEMNAFANEKHTRHISFEANKDLLKTFNNPWLLGKLEEAGVIEKVKHIQDININSGTDISTCRPIGSVLCSNNLLVTDHANKSVKLLDITQNKLTSELKLSTRPLGVCKISDNQVAVAEENKVVFVKTEPSLSIEREFAITGTYHGVGYCDKKLVVSYYNPAKVEVIDLQGNVLKTFVTDDKGQPLFSQPYHLAINPDSKLIYVSNFAFHNVVCMKFDGTVVAKYTDGELQYPLQVITDSRGMVYVCGRHNIHQITEGCKKVKVLLTRADGLNYPESISYDEIHGKLYVGQSNNDVLKVYTVTFASP